MLILLLSSTALYAQNGTIRGTVIDDVTGETILGATVVIEGTTNGAATDLDGKFEIKAAAGTYNLQVSYITYKTITIEAVVVEAGKVLLFDNIRLMEDIGTLAEVVISAEVVKVTEEALLTVKQKSVNLIDGISAASFRKMGDSDAASAVKRVPGVSIEGGKYVYVRGLGDRYTKSTLNGIDIPGLDPDRNTVQMDIFPTNVIDNIIVMKSFTADLPADFTGGVVDIATKDFPDERIMSFSISGGVNPNMHFNSNYLTYEGGSTDFLGFDDGTRAIPTDRATDLPFRANAIGDPVTGQRFNSILRSFSPILAAERKSSGMDFGVGMSFGNQLKGNRITWGYNTAITYKNTTKFYDDVAYGRYGKDVSSVTELDAREIQTGSYGENSVLIGGLAGVAMKSQLLKLRLNFLHLQNGESKAGLFEYKNTDQGANFDALQHNLEYSERGLSNLLLHGIWNSAANGIQINAKISGTKSTINDPDIRFTRYRTDSDNLTIGTESGLPERIWRYLEEDNLTGKFDASKTYTNGNGLNGKLLLGGGHLYKERNYEIQNFQIVTGNTTLTGNPNDIFLPENLWSNNNLNGVYFDPQFIPINPNKYDADVKSSFFYVSNELQLSEKLNTIIGVRAENYVQRYSGVNQNQEVFNQQRVLDNLNFFPSVNMIYALKENQNLRASFSRTIARPSFKEASFATILDPITGRTFIGGLFPDIDVNTNEVIWDGNLQATNISNFDLRWETFQGKGQTIAVSAFYKAFENPIEIVQYVQAANNFQPRNVGNGSVLGVEFELRQSLEKVTPSLSNVTFQTNVTWTTSSIEMSATEYTSRINNARDGESINNTRNMAGQAPYIINTGLSYNNKANALEMGLYYNVQGRTLQYVGIADRPDVYSVPFHGLNLNMNKTFGAEDRMKVSFSVDNILGDNREQVFQSFNATDQNFSRLNPGTSFGFSFSYSL